MKQLSVRGLDPQTAKKLHLGAKQKGVSLNRHVLEVLGGGSEKGAPRRVQHDDLAHLAGTWKAADAKAFAAGTTAFEAIDASLWK